MDQIRNINNFAIISEKGVLMKLLLLIVIISSMLFGKISSIEDANIQKLTKEFSETTDPAQRSETINKIKVLLINFNKEKRNQKLNSLKDNIK